MRRNNSKKGQLSGATNIAIGLVTLVLIVAVGAIVIGDFQDSSAECNSGFNYNESNNVCVNSTNSSQPTQNPTNTAFNISDDGLTGLSNMSNQFGTVGTVAIAAVLISLVVGAFALGRR